MTQGKVLVTGAGGFIGRWSVPPLISRGYEVHAVVGRALPPALPPQLQEAQIHRADLLDAASIHMLLDSIGPSHLLHFAWIATPSVYWTSPENYRWVDAGRHLLKRFRAAGGLRAVMAGSCAEYEWSRAGVCDEFSSLRAGSLSPATPYAECKLAMCEALSHFGSTEDMSTAWGRIFFQFGPDEHPGRLAASVIVHLLRGQEAPCSHGRQVRSFLHVADVGAAFAALLDSDTQGPVNIGSGEPISLARFLELIALRIGRPELIRLGAREAPAGEPPVLIPQIERLSREVGWRPRFGLGEGIVDTIDWWRRALAGAAATGSRSR